MAIRPPRKEVMFVEVLDLYIGLSLSFCIRDILEGRVPEDKVLAIVSRTKADTKDAEDAVFEKYCRNYWRHWDPSQVRPLYDRMLKRTIQSRVHGLMHSVTGKHWIEVPGVRYS